MTVRTLILYVGLVFLCLPVVAEDAPPPWQPDAPDGLPDKWDWIQMTSQEWLKGKLEVMYDGDLEFDSDEFDLQTLDWRDVHRVRTATILEVRLRDGSTHTGKLWVEGEDCKVISEDGEHPFPKNQLVSIAQGTPKEFSHWDAKITVGINIRSGNNNIREFNSSAKVMRRTTKNRIILDYLGNYNVTEGVEVTNNHRASVGWDMFITDRFFITPVFFEYFSDEFQNISHRETIGAGVGYQIIDTARTLFQVSGGPAYQQTKFISVEDGPNPEQTPALVAGTVYDTELTRWLDFLFEYRLQIVNDRAGQYNHHMVIDFETEITSLIDFDIKLVWDRIQKPREDADGNVPQQDDFRTIVGITFEF